MLGFKKLNRKNNNEKSDNRTVLVYPNFIFNQCYFNIVANQINFEGYSSKKPKGATAFIPKFYFTHGDRTVI
jgi:hypothetical protein